MRILIISALFPPDVLGGAEMSAFSFATWLISHGHDVGVLCTAKSPDEEMFGTMLEGLRMYRCHWPRQYPMLRFAEAKSWQKPVWHLQDHIDPANKQLVSRVLDDFQPDIVNVHVIQGVGHNVLSELGSRDIPVAYCMHDMGLACIKTSMFKQGRECVGQCLPCWLSSRLKLAMVRKTRRIGFYSPSRANLDRVSQYFPISQYPNASILNPNRYPTPSVERKGVDHVRLLYAGRLQETKGVAVLLQSARRVFERLGKSCPFRLTLVGNGPQEAALRTMYEREPWCNFAGFITQAELSNEMANSDVICVPSIWFENSPGVLIQALAQGLPALGSRIGGIPELIEHERNGLLVEPGEVSGWEEAIERSILDADSRKNWREYALSQCEKFDQDHLGELTLSFFDALIGAPSANAR